jgi:pimeloyl-ACP methyl ester carboxylesterase
MTNQIKNANDETNTGVSVIRDSNLIRHSSFEFRHSRTSRLLVRAARIVVLIYIGLCLMFAWLQTKMIFPGAATQGQRHAVVRPSPTLGEEIVRLRATDGTEIVGLFGPALSQDGQVLSLDQRKAAPTILYFYGNGMCLADCIGEFRRFRKLGANVLICDFAGYGMSAGVAGEAGVYATANAAYEHLLTRDDIDRGRIVVAGWSLGAAAAIEIASTKPVAGLITLSAFSTLHDMARRTVPFMPTSLLLRHHFDNRSKIAKVTCPILMFHGRRDSLIPFYMLNVLKSAATSPLKAIPIDEANHNDIYEVGGDVIYPQIAEFLRMQLK